MPGSRLEVPLEAPPAPNVAHARLAAHFSTTFILESRDGPSRVARYSIVGWAPAGTIRLDPSGLQVEGSLPQPGAAEDPLAFVRRVLAEHRPPAGQTHDLPFVGGLVGFVGYDFAKTLEPTLDEVDAPEPWPRALLGLYLDAIVYDHAEGTARYVSDGTDRRADLALLHRPVDRSPLRVGPLAAPCDATRFSAMVGEAQELLRAGEFFQIVLSRPYTASFSGDLGECYARLREGEHAPYLFHLRFEGKGRPAVQLLGASPETLVRVRGRTAETFPIAGTRPLTGDAARDQAAARELLADRKEAAEHAMLVDLARNDLARVCRAGTVQVVRLRDVEPSRTVQHLVSHVVGELAAGRDALDALAAVFPAGTVSGAPKVRAMEHIARLEPTPRGPYGGAVCYASFNGGFDSAIAIRSLAALGDRLTVQAGAGIVLASRPEAEFAETRAKAATMLEALRPFGALPPRAETEVAAR